MGILDFFKRKSLLLWQVLWEEVDFSEPNNSNVISKGWNKNVLVHACIRKTASSASSVSLLVKDKAGKILEDHPIRKLIQNPNPFMSEYDFWYSIIAFRLLFGNAYFFKERDNANRIIHLWPLFPPAVKPIFQDRSLIAFEFHGNSIQVFQPNQIIWFRLFDPQNFYSDKVFSPTMIALNMAELDNVISQFLQTYLKEGGFPLGIIKSKLRLTEDEAKLIQQRWMERYSGVEGWKTPAVLDADAEYQQIGSHLKDISFSEIDERIESRICAAFNIPPILVGAKIGLDRSTMANYKESRLSWWQDTLLPLYDDLLDTLQNQLQPDYKDSDRIVLEWDFSNTPIFEELQTNRNAQILKLFELGAISVNEVREYFGFERLDAAPKSINHIKTKSASNLELKEDLLDPEEQLRNWMEMYLEEQYKAILKEIEETNAG